MAVEEQEVLEELSLDETLAQTLRDIESRESDEPEETPDDEPAETDDDTPDDDPDEPPADDDEPEGEEDPVDDEPVKDEKPDEPAKPSRRPPGSWSAKGKAEFAKLPEHIQDEVLKRENDFHKGIESYKDRASQFDRLHQEFLPYMPMIQASGSTPEQTIRNLMNTAYRLKTGTPQERGQLLMQVAQQYGAELPSGPAEQKDPYIQQLEQRLAQFENQFVTHQQSIQQRTFADAQGSIEAFRAEPDEQGQPKHLFFDDVRDDMADRIEAANRRGEQLTLQDAYDAAIWARPDIREQMLTQQQQAEEAKRKAAAAKKAREAKKRAGVNVTTTGAHPESGKAKTGSIDDTLRATMEAIESRSD